MQYVLVHGAFSDGSSWHRVIPELRQAGHVVTAVQLGLDSFAGDVATVRRAIARTTEPVVLAGHSYGGAVITEAADGRSEVKALVYVAALAPDAGQSAAQLAERFPSTAGSAALRADEAGYASLDPDRFVELFAAGAPTDDADVLAAVQGPINGACFGATLSAAAWTSLPSVYVRARNDQMIHPDLQAWSAGHLGARVIELDAPHAAHLTHPQEVAMALLSATA